MKNTVKYKLDHNLTKPYYLEVLEDSFTLGNNIKDLVDLDQGEFFLLIPEGSDINTSRLYDFEGCRVVDEVFLETEMAHFMYEKMQKLKNPHCTFDKILADAGNDDFGVVNPYLKLYDGISNLEMYFHLGKEDLTEKRLDQVISEAHDLYRSVGIISSCVIPQRETHFQKKDLELLAEHVEMLTLLAYDGEDYIFWEKNIDYQPDRTIFKLREEVDLIRHEVSFPRMDLTNAPITKILFDAIEQKEGKGFTFLPEQETSFEAKVDRWTRLFFKSKQFIHYPLWIFRFPLATLQKIHHQIPTKVQLIFGDDGCVILWSPESNYSMLSIMTETGFVTDGFWGALLEYNALEASVRAMKAPDFERVLKDAKLIVTKNPGQEYFLFWEPVDKKNSV